MSRVSGVAWMPVTSLIVSSRISGVPYGSALFAELTTDNDEEEAASRALRSFDCQGIEARLLRSSFPLEVRGNVSIGTKKVGTMY